MMRIASVHESQKLDRVAQDQHGLSGEILMESAGAIAAHEIRNFWSALKLDDQRHSFVAVVCGPGGNGADGLVIARHLASGGLNVRTYLIDAKTPHELFQVNLKRLPENIAKRNAADIDEVSEAALIVDALLGVGSSREVSGLFKRSIDGMNESAATTISVDLPSGLDADRGEILGRAVKANVTLTFGLAKRGFFVNEGPDHVGQLKILPIGFPIDLVRDVAKTQTAFGENSARQILPDRKSSSNKASHGRAAIFAGRPGMVGAGLLAGLGAMRAGTGYVTLITHLASKDQKAKAEIASVAPEFLTMAIDDPQVWEKTEGSSFIVGPGFGVGEATLKIMKELHRRNARTVLIDADALTTLAGERKKNHALPLHKSWILTPHAGELARLIGGDPKDLETHRFEAAERAARELNAIVVFKGFRTVISDGRRTCVVLSGNAALAKAGSGDILSGIIGGFLAQKIDPFKAACLGAYVHGRIADEWLKSGRDILSLQPSDLARSLPVLLGKIRQSHAYGDHPEIFE